MMSAPATPRTRVLSQARFELGTLLGNGEQLLVSLILPLGALVGLAYTTVRRLSGGQKQRLALAAALIGGPEVLFLDEPTAGLDPHGRLDVYDLLREVADGGTTVVVTTHSFEEAQALATHLVVISDGRTAASGSPADVVGDRTLESVYFELTRKAR